VPTGIVVSKLKVELMVPDTEREKSSARAVPAAADRVPRQRKVIRKGLLNIRNQEGFQALRYIYWDFDALVFDLFGYPVEIPTINPSDATYRAWAGVHTRAH
jgi:hypothetical protein